jgi:hypothetical protein
VKSSPPGVGCYMTNPKRHSSPPCQAGLRPHSRKRYSNALETYHRWARLSHFCNTALRACQRQKLQKTLNLQQKFDYLGFPAAPGPPVGAPTASFESPLATLGQCYTVARPLGMPPASPIDGAARSSASTVSRNSANVLSSGAVQNPMLIRKSSGARSPRT